MKKPSFNRFTSLSSRISLWIVLSAALLLAVAMGFLWRSWAKSLRAEVNKDAAQVLDNTVLRVNGILEDAELAANNMVWLVERELDNPDAMVTISNEAIRNNPVLSGCSISFEPYFFPEKGLYYSIYSYRTAQDTVGWEQEGDDSYQYFYQNWYLLPRLLNRPCWTEPYNETSWNVVPEMDTEMLVSYCRPIYDRDSTFVGSVSVDLSLKWLTETVSGVRPYPNSYSILVGHGGTFLVHPDPEKLFYQTLFTDGLLDSDPVKYELGQAMRHQEAGMRVVIIDGERNFVYFQPLETTGWSVAIVCPEDDIFGDFNRLRRVFALSILLALLLLFFLLGWLIRRQLLPLRDLAVEADYIASGNLDHPLEPLERIDEIGQLNHSFRNMQTSLVSYIDELTKTTASKERMDRELQIARGIQMAMVPHDFPRRNDVDLYAQMTPAREVGGDLYDFCIQDDKLFFCLGDVSGKGVPASLLMAVARGMFRILARQGQPPAEIARQINDLISEKNEQMNFVTMFIAALDLKTGELAFCNAGHNAPVLIPEKCSEACFLDCKPNVAVGIMPGFPFEGQTVPDFRGKALFVYTDGLNEAEDASHVQFGEDRMLDILREDKFAGACGTIEKMSQAVALHVDGAEPSDDLTMLCVRMAK